MAWGTAWGAAGLRHGARAIADEPWMGCQWTLPSKACCPYLANPKLVNPNPPTKWKGCVAEQALYSSPFFPPQWHSVPCNSSISAIADGMSIARIYLYRPSPTLCLLHGYIYIGHCRRHVDCTGIDAAGTQADRLSESLLTVRSTMPNACLDTCLDTCSAALASRHWVSVVLMLLVGRVSHRAVWLLLLLLIRVAPPAWLRLCWCRLGCW